MSELLKVDINDPTAVLPDDEIEINTEGDAFSGPPPVPDGEHVATLSLGQRGIQTGTTKDGSAYYMFHLEARVQAEGDNFLVFDSASTLVSEYSGTSRVVGILKAIGVQVPARTTLKEVAKLFADALVAQPQVKITTRWEGYDPDAPSGKAGKQGKVVVRGQKNFPEGRHTMESPITGNEISAQARVTKYAPVQ